jgi:type I restriction enzyme M protein
MKNVFYLPEKSHWSYIKTHAKQDDLAIKIDTALATVEKNNKALKGNLPDNYFSRLGLDPSKLAVFSDLATANVDKVIPEFGITLGGEAGIFCVTKGTAQSNLKVTVECLFPKRGSKAEPADGRAMPAYRSGGVV